MTRVAKYYLRWAKVVAAGTVILALGPVSLARAQNVPVAFIHGFNSNGQAWNQTASLLRSRLQITTITPTTPWTEQFATQSAVLRDALNTWGQSGVIALAHSNGGLNTRNYVQTQGASTRINRLITINTPHGGAPLAQYVLQGAVFAYFGNMANAIGQALSFYAYNDPEWGQGGVLRPASIYLGQGMQYLGQTLARNDIYVGLGFGAAVPVTQQEVPNSAFLNALNNGLGTEANLLSARIGISNDLHPNGALFELISSNPEGWRRFRSAAMANFALLYDYYDNGPDPYLANYAWLWRQAYLYVAEMDLAWQDYIGALAGFYAPLGIANLYHNDGFIPSYSSAYPGATLQINYFMPQYPSIPHTGEMDDPFMRTEYENILKNRFGVLAQPGVGDPYEPPPECITVNAKTIC